MAQLSCSPAGSPPRTWGQFALDMRATRRLTGEPFRVFRFLKVGLDDGFRDARAVELEFNAQAGNLAAPESYRWACLRRKSAYAVRSSRRLLMYEKLDTAVTNGLRHRHRLRHILPMILLAE